jgi:tRNA 2-thiouridine synthesizing protein A
MAKVEIDARGFKCPVPVLKMSNAVSMKEVHAGDTLVVLADCPTFEDDVRSWCTRQKKVLVVLKDEGNNVKRAEVRI